MENKNKTYHGNYFWILEALKVTSKEICFEKNFDCSKLSKNDIIFYDSLVINEEKEDSLFFHITVNYFLKILILDRIK